LNYDEIVSDFVQRTRQNLRAAQRLHSSGQGQFYEVTHLINSLLGLVVVPHERMLNKLPATTLADFQTEGLELTILPARRSGPADLKELVHGMRNAVAHFKLEAAGDGGPEIESLTLWNTTPDGTLLWGVRFTPSELRGFVEHLAETLRTAIGQP